MNDATFDPARFIERTRGDPPDKRKRRPGATGAASIVFISTSAADNTETRRASQARYLGRKYGLRVTVARVVADALLVGAAR
jgi:hypothetical protein